MNKRSDQNKLIEWLNALIVMAQSDKSLPSYLARLFNKPDQYQKALQLIREAPKGVPPPAAPGDALNKEEWEKVYKFTTRAKSLRKLFASERDPFFGADVDEISVLADVSDLTTDSQTMFYSRNGTFQLVLETVRQLPELDTAILITDGLNKFYTLLETKELVAEELNKLAGSHDWYPVLASLYDKRDYTADESQSARESLEQWNKTLTTELRSILLKPTKLYRVPKKLIQLAWERRSLFKDALALIPDAGRLNDFERRRQVANVAYPLFIKEAKSEMEEIDSDLQLLALIARHYISVRKFVKLDGLVSEWPRIASLAMENFPNLEYVEGFLLDPNKQPPTVEELKKKEASKLYELCAKDPAVGRFFKLKPYFSEINEDELRRYRPLASVKISDPAQQPSSPTIVSPPTANLGATPVTPTAVTPARVCELVIKAVSKPEDAAPDEVGYEIALVVSGSEVAKGTTTFSIKSLLDRMLANIGVTSEESLQSIMSSLFSGPEAEKILVRGGTQLLNQLVTYTGLEEKLAEVFRTEGPVRLVITSGVDILQYLPWEWLPRPGYAELLLSNARFSLVRSSTVKGGIVPGPLSSPIRVLGVFPNSPVGARDISDGSIKALEVLLPDIAQYKALVREDATLIQITDELEALLPHIVHFEGYVNLNSDPLSSAKLNALFILSSLTTQTQSVDWSRFADLLSKNKVQLFVVGRNESNRMLGNVGAAISSELVRKAVPAVLAPIHAVDEVTATSLTTEFYRAFLAGNSLEQSLYLARRKVASRGGDWTAFALFANPSVLDFFQPLPPTP